MLRIKKIQDRYEVCEVNEAGVIIGLCKMFDSRISIGYVYEEFVAS